MLKGLRFQILVLALLPSLLVSLLAGVYLNYTHLRYIDEYVDQRGKAAAAQIANIARYEILNQHTDVLQSIANTSLEERGLRSISIFDTKGQLLAHAGPRLPPFETLLKWHKNAIALAHDEHTMGFFYPIEKQVFTSNLGNSINALPSPDRIGWVAIEFNSSDFTVQRYDTSLRQYGVLLVALIISLFIGLNFSQRIGRDLKQLALAVRRIGQGKTDENNDVYSISEFQSLASNLTQIADTQQTEYNELRHSVELTTSDLQETIEAIEIQNIELSIAQKEAQKASKIKSEFLANTSHEIRTPLNGIIGFTKILQRTSLTPQQLEYLETIQVSSEGLMTIINDILDFSKIEAGKLELERSPFNLRQILEEVVSLFAPAAYEKHLDIALLIYSDVPLYLVSDPARIKQIFSNLISNAIKFTETGDVIVRVALDNLDTGNGLVTLHASVSDTGIGMDKEQVRDLFQAFNQANSSISREYGGTGLGLAIVKNLVEMLDGNIEASSEQGEGTCFDFTLKAGLQRQTPANSHRLLTGKSVIVYEPHSASLNAISGLLLGWQMHVHSANSLDELEEAASCYHSDVILYSFASDVDALTARNTIERLEREYNTRVVALIPVSLSQISSFHDAGMAYCSKPVSEHILYRTLARAIHPSAVEDPTPANNKAHSFNSNIKVLAIDDNAANLKLLTVLLSDLGISCDTADNGKKALSATQQKDYDIIFMDVQMPVMNGLDASIAIREHSDTPIIALTAHALADEKAKLLDAGVNAYLTKPINEQQIKDCLIEYCDLSQDSAPADVVDVAACLRLANGKPDLAIDMFSMLLERLPADIADMKALVKQQKHDQLLEHVHKLHGACCYTGVPGLKDVCLRYEQALKEKKYDQVIAFCESIDNEANKLIEWNRAHSLGTLINKLL